MDLILLSTKENGGNITMNDFSILLRSNDLKVSDIHTLTQNLLKEDYCILCQECELFTIKYCRERILQSVAQADRFGADFIFAGVSQFDRVISVAENLFWVDYCSSYSFILVLKKYYNQLLNHIVNKKIEHINDLNFLSENKFIIYPFIKKEKDSLTNNLELLASESKLRALKNLTEFYRNNNKRQLKQTNFNNLIIPTYIINLEHRKDRLTNILAEFKNKPEFHITIQKACVDLCGTKGLWLSICQIVEKAIKSEDDLVLIVEDDHVFTKDYNRDTLINNIIEAGSQGADVLSGGISGGFTHVISVTDERYWVDHFWGTQFIVVFKKFYKTILKATFKKTDTADDFISELSGNKMVLFPFISVQKDFGYSDITKDNAKRSDLSKIFADAQKKIEIFYTVCQKLKAPRNNY